MKSFKYTSEEHRRRLDEVLKDPPDDAAFWDACLEEADAARKAFRAAGQRCERVTLDDLRTHLR